MIVCLFGMAAVFQHLEAATYLGRSTETRDSSADSASHTTSLEYSSKDSSSATSSEIVVVEGSEPAKGYAFFLMDDVPDDWMPGRVRTSAEIGLQHWIPSSRSGQYEASYDIDPVTVTMFDSSVRVRGWVFMVDYTTSLEDPDSMKNLLAQISRVNPGVGAWWSLYAETGRVEGSAETEDEGGNPVLYPVDTEWNRVGIELRTYDGFAVGLVYEDLAMPVIHTFNNEEVAFAMFDDQTRARTLSVSLGYDRARRLLNDFEEGGAWAWSLEGSLGLGWLDYSKDEARAAMEAQGYEFESVDLLFAGAVDARLGYTYSKEIWNTETQFYIGGRFRASGWMNWAGDPPEPDTVELETGFGLVTPGVFGRISFQW